jgi:GPH family glycoside/pentoside/hexuronide:cation symporter
MTMPLPHRLLLSSTLPPLRFGISHFGKTLIWAAVEVYGIFSLTELVKLSPALASMIFVFLLVWSAICDFLVGLWLDHTRGANPSHIMRVSGIFAAALFFLGFAPLAAGAEYQYLALAAIFLFRPVFALADVPHNGLLRELGRDSRMRSRLSALRLISGAAAYFAVSLAALELLPSGPADSENFGTFTAVIAIAAAVLFVCSPAVGSGLPGSVRDDRAAPESPLSALHAPRLVLLLGATMAGIVGFSLMLKGLPYIAKFELFDAAWVGHALMMITIAKLGAAPLWYWLGRAIGAVNAFAIAYLTSAGSAVLLSLGLARTIDLAFGLALLGASLGGSSMFSWVLIANVVEDAERRTGHRVQALMFGSFTCGSKIATGLGGGLLAMILSGLGTGDFASSAGSAFCVLLLATSLTGIALLRWLGPSDYSARIPAESAST